MDYDFRKIEADWQKKWAASRIYEVNYDPSKPKYYVLDMFPYPSGAGLHVGHPLGYIASDIFSRYKRLKGYNVLHPMGFDSFGLPAEQYAIETGQHPAVTTKNNIANFKDQLEKIGFCFDWRREVQTSDPQYYKWTQWIFLRLFDSYFDKASNKAKPIDELIKAFQTRGSSNHQPPTSNNFTAEDWAVFDKKKRQDILMEHRLAYCGYGEVNWCEALGTVLANDEVVNGLSERGGYPVEKRKMRQWFLRITDYADRLLEGLERVEFSDAMKEMQRNWIGRSEGAEMDFAIKGSDRKLRVYTTRPDTIFGVDFMVVAPEHELLASITSTYQKAAIKEYLSYVKSRSDRERQADVKQITGCFTGAYAINPFNGREIPIWTAEYVLSGYGTGAIMAVPCGDQRDFLFAKHFDIPVANIIGSYFNGREANPTKDAVLENSGFLDGLFMKDAIKFAIDKITETGIGKKQVNFRMRDAGFSRQRYWGEPFPIIWSDGIALPLDAEELPLELPFVEKYGPGPNGEGPLANLKDWVLTPTLSTSGEGDAEIVAKKEAKGAALVPKYKVSTPFQYELAKQNRKEYTEAENILWQELRNNKLDAKFRRQHPIESYIVDFVCLQHALIIEADGGYHESIDQKRYDEERTDLLNRSGFKVIRFTNAEILTDIFQIIKKIKTALTNSEAQNIEEKFKGNELSLPSPLAEQGKGVRETSTMPGYAGSSWYFLRYMDPHNHETFCDRKLSDYWNQVDLYVGGTEHAVGHLLYSRMWTKVMYDLGLIGFDEPFKKLLNQGMIQGSSRFVYRVTGKNQFVSTGLIDQYSVNELHVDVNIVDGLELNISAFKKWKPEYADAEFILENGRYICGADTEKMSKSKYNTVNPDELCNKYGADTFRMYEMFLGPVEASKPWDTKGIEGVHRFLRKLWRLFFDDIKGPIWTSSITPTPSTDETPAEPGSNSPLPGRGAGGEVTDAELKILHRTIKKIEEDTERFSFNTAVSAFMIAVNELTDIKCHKKELLEKLLVLIAPYAPHIAEELWNKIGNQGSVLNARFPVLDPAYLAESTKEYPISINGKLRTNISLALDLDQKQVEEIVLQNDIVKKWLEGKAPKKIIFVKNKMVNVVL